MEKIHLYSFWICMLLCASVFLSAIWIAPEPPEVLMKTAFSFFVIGFANFLLWAPRVIYRLLEKLS